MKMFIIYIYREREREREREPPLDRHMPVFTGKIMFPQYR